MFDSSYGLCSGWQYHKASVVSCYLLYFDTVCSKSVSARVRKYTCEDHSLFSSGGREDGRTGGDLGLHKTNKSAPVFFNLVISRVISQCRLTGLQPASAVPRAHHVASACFSPRSRSRAAHLLSHSQRETWGNQPAKAYVTHGFLLL